MANPRFRASTSAIQSSAPYPRNGTPSASLTSSITSGASGLGSGSFGATSGAVAGSSAGDVSQGGDSPSGGSGGAMKRGSMGALRHYGPENNSLGYNDVNLRGGAVMSKPQIKEERKKYGLCLTCEEDPTQCYRMGRSLLLSKTKKPLTKPDVVHQGICLRCRPEANPARKKPPIRDRRSTLSRRASTRFAAATIARQRAKESQQELMRDVDLTRASSAAPAPEAAASRGLGSPEGRRKFFQEHRESDLDGRRAPEDGTIISAPGRLPADRTGSSGSAPPTPSMLSSTSSTNPPSGGGAAPLSRPKPFVPPSSQPSPPTRASPRAAPPAPFVPPSAANTVLRPTPGQQRQQPLRPFVPKPSGGGADAETVTFDPHEQPERRAPQPFSPSPGPTPLKPRFGAGTTAAVGGVRRQRRKINPHLRVDSEDDNAARKARADALQREQDRLDAIEDAADVDVLRSLIDDMLQHKKRTKEPVDDVIGILSDNMLQDPNNTLPLQTYGICTLLQLLVGDDDDGEHNDTADNHGRGASIRNDRREVIFNSSIVDAVVTAMTTAVSSTTSASSSASAARRSLCLNSGCELLRALATDASGTGPSPFRAELVEAGGLRSVVGALRCSGRDASDDSQVASSALAAVRALAPPLPKNFNNTSGRRLGGVGGNNTGNASIPNVWGSRQNLGLASSAMVATLDAMDTHYDSAKVQREACRTLSVLSSAMFHWSVPQDDGIRKARPVLENIAGAMSSHPDDVAVQSSGCQALYDCYLAMSWDIMEAALGRGKQRKKKEEGAEAMDFDYERDYHDDFEDEDDDVANLVDHLCFHLLTAAVDYPVECSNTARQVVDRLLYSGGKTGSDNGGDDDDDDDEKNAIDDERVYEYLVRQSMERACAVAADLSSSGATEEERVSKETAMLTMTDFVRTVLQRMKQNPSSHRVASVGFVGLSLGLLRTTLDDTVPALFYSPEGASLLEESMSLVIEAMNQHGAQYPPVQTRGCDLVWRVCQDEEEEDEEEPMEAERAAAVARGRRQRRKLLRRLKSVQAILNVMVTPQAGEDVQVKSLQTLVLLVVADPDEEEDEDDDEIAVDPKEIRRTILLILAAYDDSQAIQSVGQEALAHLPPDEEEGQEQQQGGPQWVERHDAHGIEVVR